MQKGRLHVPNSRGEPSRHLPAPAPRALTFDLDDTLWDVAEVIRHADQTLHRWLTRRYPRLPAQYSPAELRQIMRDIAQTQPRRAHDLSELRRRALAEAARATGYDSRIADDALAVFLEARNRVRLYSDVLPALETLATRYTLAVITNGNADISRIGLGGFFAASISAADAGCAKPDAAPFLLACRQLGCHPAQVLHAGDDAECDIAGAAQAGMQTAWINRRGEAWQHPAAQPDLEVTDLLQLSRRLCD